MDTNLKLSLLVITRDKTEEHDLSSLHMSIGSASNCAIVLSAKDNVAPIHARIERADDGIYIVAQSNSMVTQLNGSPLVAGRRQKLKGGDRITVGTANTIQVRTRSASVKLGTRRSASLWRRNVIFVAVVGGLTAVLALVIIASKRNTCSDVEIRLASTNDLIRSTVELQVTPPQKNCIKRIEYFIGAEKFDERTGPYNTKINPADPKLAQLDHSIPQQVRLVVEDQQGRRSEKFLPFPIRFTHKQPGADNIPFVVEGNADPSPSPSQSPDSTTSPNVVKPQNEPGKGVVKNADAIAKINNLATFLSGEYDYVLDDPAFYEAIQQNALELGQRYSEIWQRAKPSSEQIRVEFSAQNLKPAFGYVMALSRSNFDSTAKSDGRGFWQLTATKLRDEGFIAAPSELTDSLRGPRVAAMYSQSVYGTFEHNLLLTVAFYDVSTMTAGQINADLARKLSQSQRKSLPELTKAGVIKDQQLNNLIKFFAAAYVASYPWDFGVQTPSLNNIYN
jgi:hypothetical protein